MPIPISAIPSVFEKPGRHQRHNGKWSIAIKQKRGRFLKKAHALQPAGLRFGMSGEGNGKRREGPVTWDTNCMGCRYCMVSCPFDVPKFEHNSARPQTSEVQSLLGETSERRKSLPAWKPVRQRRLPFGARRELIEEANTRIYKTPKNIISHIYGEHEVGGTGIPLPLIGSV